MEISEERFCSNCKSSLLNAENCSSCSSDSNKYDQFFYVPIEPQLRSLIQHYHSSISDYIEMDRNFVDLVDSKHYLETYTANTIKLMIYTDGIAVFKNPGKSIWPVILKICELPPRLRQSKLNTVICGVYFGNGKPNSEILFTKMVEELNNLKTTGLEILINQNTHFVYIDAYGITADLPAKALVLNMKQFNGFYGCCKCDQKGVPHLIIFELYNIINQNIC